MSTDRRTQTPQPVKHPVNPNLTPHNLPYGPGVDRNSVESAQRKFIMTHKPSKPAEIMARMGGAMDEKIRDFNLGSIHSRSPWRKNLFVPDWISNVSGSLQRPAISAALADYRSRLEGVGTTPEQVVKAQKMESDSYDAIDNHNQAFQKKSSHVLSFMAADFCEHLRKEAGAKPRARGYQGGHDFKTTNQIAGARAMHGAKPPRTATAEEMRPHQQYGGYDWSNYRSDMGNDLSGTWGASSGPGYMEGINGGRDSVLARGGDLSAMGVTPLQAAPSPTAIPAAGNASYTPPVSGGALGGQSYPAPGSPEYAAAVQRQARGSDDYRAARNGEGRMGFKPDGSWGLVTPAMEGQPIQRTATAPAPTAQTAPQPVAQTAPQPVAQTAPQPVAQTAPSPATQTAPAPMAQTAPPTGPDPFDSRTTGPGQFNNLPPSPFGFDGSGEVDPFQGPSRPVADYDPFNMTTGPDQYTGVPESPAGFGPAPSGPAIDFPGTSPLNVTTGPNQFTGLPQSPAGFGGAPRPYTGESPFNTTTGPNQFTGLPPSPAGFDVRNLLSSPWAGVDPRFQQPRPMNPWQSLYGLNA